MALWRCSPFPMVVGLLQFELLIHDASSLKDKRRVVQSVKDRLHRDHLCAVAEIGRFESHAVALLGLAVVGHEGKRVGEVLDTITNRLRELRDAELGDVSREVLHGQGVAGAPDADDGDPRFRHDPVIDERLLRRGERAARENNA